MAARALLLVLLTSAFAGSTGGSADAPTAFQTDSALGDFLRALHAQQHPPKASCRSRRLLLTQFSARHFEGIGSLLKLLFMGLAEAAHSNRTLVWGLDLPFLFEHSREAWQGPDPSQPLASVHAGGLDLDCRGWLHQGGGPYNCLFLPLSSCSLDDSTPAELAALGVDGFSDGARLRIQEARRGVSLYHPPFHVEAFKRFFSPTGAGAPIDTYYPRHTWAAAVAAYAFRLRPRVFEALEARRVALWEGGSGESCPPGSPPPSLFISDDPDAPPPPVWAMHVRRGDVAALKTTYGNRLSYEFSDFWAAALKRAAVTPPEAAPAAVLILADDPEAPSWLQSLCDSGGSAASSDGFVSRTKRRRNVPSLDDWPGGRTVAPRFFTVSAASRAHTPHGSHTVAADGGCQLETCALPAEVVTHYRAEHIKTGAPPKSARLMRILVESVEDLFNLAHGDVIFAQSTSHYSTAAVLLSWARSGWPSPTSTELLDEEAVEAGMVATSFLHFASMNLTSAMPTGRGHERWIRHTKLFKEGLARADTAACGGNVDGYLFTCDSEPRERMRVTELLPILPGRMFDLEAARWGGRSDTSSDGSKALRLWPGECPLSTSLDGIPFAQLTPKVRVMELINHGAAHSELHPNQALLCWRKAESLLGTLIAAESAASASGKGVTDEDLAVYDDVLKGNVAALASRSMYPYSLPRDRVAHILNVNLGTEGALLLGEGLVRSAPVSPMEEGTTPLTATARPTKRAAVAAVDGSTSVSASASASASVSTISPADAAAEGLVFAPIQLGCACRPATTSTGGGDASGSVGASSRHLLAVGWEGVPHSYANVLKGLMDGITRIAARQNGTKTSEVAVGVGGEAADAATAATAASPAWVLDFAAAPIYRRSWSNSSEAPDARFTVSTQRGMPLRHDVFRMLPLDAIAPPAFFGRNLPRSAYVGAPAPPGTPAPAWAVNRLVSGRWDLPASSKPTPPTCPDVLLRAHFPLDLSPPPCASTRVWMFGTTEMGFITTSDVHQASLPSPTTTDAAAATAVWKTIPKEGFRILTPSLWSANGFIASGAPRDRIDILPHGFDPHTFHPLPTSIAPGQKGVTRNALRKSIGWASDGCVVVLSVGHMRWKKGADKLLIAAVEVAHSLKGVVAGDGGRKKSGGKGKRDDDDDVEGEDADEDDDVSSDRGMEDEDEDVDAYDVDGAAEEEEEEVGSTSRSRPATCIRLVLKGLDALYGSSSVLEGYLDTINVTLPARDGSHVVTKKPSKKGTTMSLRAAVADLTARGRLVLEVRGSSLPDRGVAALMQAADVYASPYRAEGFNLPVLEAAACGLPLVVTAGGPTDAFTHESFTKYIASSILRNGAGSQGSEDTIHLEVDHGSHVRALREAVEDAAWRATASRAAAAWVLKSGFTWEDVAASHQRLFEQWAA